MPIVVAGAYSSNYGSGFLLADGVEVACTIQCVHCGRHFLCVKGSGKVRGFCMECGGPHCGAPKCWHPDPHISYLKKLERHNDNPQKYPDL